MHRPSSLPRSNLGSPLRVLWLARWRLAAAVVLGALLGLVYCLFTPPTYRATTSLLIEPKDANVVEIDKVYETQGIVREYHRTQYELLQSTGLIAEVIAQLKLAERAEYADYQRDENGRLRELGLRDRVLEKVHQVMPDVYDFMHLSALRKRQETLLDDVTAHLTVDPVPNTYLVKISFTSESAELSALVANAVVASYMSRERAARTGIGYEAADLLVQRVEESRKALQASEQALQNYLEKEDLVNVGGGRELAEDELTEVSRRMRDASRQKAELANVYARIQAAGSRVESLQDIPLIQDDPLVRETKAAYLIAKEAFDQLSPRYGAKHPTRVAAQARLDTSRQAYFTQLRIRADGIRSNYELAAKTEADLKAEVTRSTSRMQNLDRKDYDLKVLQREVDTNRDLYQTFLKRYKETQATADLDIGSARVIDRAVAPGRPTWPRTNLIVIGCALLGLFAASALLLLRDALDDSVKSTEQLEALTGVPVLCSLPLISGEKSAADKLARLEIEDPKSLFAEGVRTLRTSILLHDRGAEKTKLVMVCSSVPEEGKTSISTNLAMALGERESVLLIDCDLRKPRIASLLRVGSGTRGLTDVLTGDCTLDDAVIEIERGGIDVLVAGTRRENPQILLASDAFAQLLQHCAQHYDRIIIDTSPCQLVSDALIFAANVDAVILVARADSTPQKVVASTAKRLDQTEAPLIGAVLNYVDIRRAAGYEGGYYYRYGYYG
jgi:succinoglycan biosynthesis transport protein ExoP